VTTSQDITEGRNAFKFTPTKWLRIEASKKEAPEAKILVGKKDYVKVRYLGGVSTTPTQEGGRLKWRGENEEVHLYHLGHKKHQGKRQLHPVEEWSYEQEVILKKKPLNSTLTFEVEAKGLEYRKEGDKYVFYRKIRLPASEEEICEDIFYLNPIVVRDSQGKETKPKVELKDGILTIKINKNFLNKAAYPISVDPSYTVKTSASYASTQTNNQRKLARTSDGTLWCVYHRSDGSYNQVYASYSTNDGETWTEEQLTNVSGNQYYPSIAIDSQDNIHVVWRGYGWGSNTNRNNIRYRKRTSSGWQSHEAVTDISYHQYDPAIAVDSQDNIHAVWCGGGWGTNTSYNNIQYRKRTSSGWQTQESVTDTNNNQSRPAIAIDSNDNVHVVWQGKGWGTNTANDDIQYRKRTSSGWQTQEDVTDKTDYQQSPSIAIDSNDDIHVVWYGYGWGTNTSYYNIRYRKRTSSGWQSHEAVTDKDNNQYDPTIAIDKNDNIHVVWHGQGWGSNPSYYNIQYRKRTSSGWQTQEGLTDVTAYQYSPNCIWALHPTVSGEKPNRTKTGYAFVWVDGSTIKFYKSDDLAWDAPPKAYLTVDSLLEKSNLNTTFSIDAITWPGYSYTIKSNIESTANNSQRALARTSDGTLWCVYCRSDGSYDQVYAAYSTDGGVSWTEEQVTNASDNQYCPSIAIDSNDNVHVVWEGKGWGSNTGYKNIQYRKRTSSGWQTQEALTDKDADQLGPSIAIDSDNDIHVVWYGKGWGDNPSYYNIQYRKRTLTTWETQEAITDADLHQWKPSIAIDSLDNIHVVWHGCGWGAHTAGDDIQYRKKTLLGWQTQESVTDVDGEDQTEPCIAIDSNDNVHVVWRGEGWGVYTGYVNIQYRKRTSSGWQTQEAVTDKDDDQYAPSIAIDSNDNVHVVWSGYGWGTNVNVANVQHRKRTSVGWQDPESVTDTSTSTQERPNLIWALHPTVSGAKTNRAERGFALVWRDGSTFKIYKSNDLDWETPPATCTIDSLLKKLGVTSSFGIDTYIGTPLLESISIDSIIQKLRSVYSTVDTLLKSLFIIKENVSTNSTAYSNQRKLARTSDGILWCVYLRWDGSHYQVYAAYSADDGETWTEEQVTNASDNQYCPSIAIDSNDDIHVVWSGYGWGTNTNYRNIQYRKRTSSGWQTQESVTDKNRNQWNPSIAIDSNDNVHVVWEGKGWGTNTEYDNIQYRKRTSSGWQTQESVTDKDRNQPHPAITIDSQDNIHVVWSGQGWGTNNNYDNVQYRKRTSSGWQTQESVTDKDASQTSPAIAVDGSDNVHVVWAGAGWGTSGHVDIQYRKRTSSGWQNQEAVTDASADQSNPTIAVDEDDNVHVVWNCGSYAICYRKRTSTEWQSLEDLISASAEQEYPSLIWALHPTVSNGKPNRTKAGYAFVWVDGTTLKYYKSSDLDWGSPYIKSYSCTINTFLRKLYQKPFSIDAFIGPPLVRYLFVSALLQKFNLSHSFNIDTLVEIPIYTYTVKTGATSDSTSYNSQRKLARTSNGTLWCVYHRSDGSYLQIYAAYSTDDGESWTEEQVTNASDNQYCPSIAIDSNDNVHVVWYGRGWGSNTSKYNIQYRKRTSSGWQTQESVTDKGEDQYYPSIVIDSNDDIHVVWEGKGWGTFSETVNIRYRKRTSSGWQDHEAVTDKSDHQYRPAIAIDSNDNVHVVWEGKGWGTNPGNQNIRHRKRTSETWMTPDPVTDVSSDQYSPSIAIDSNDDIHVVWYGYGWGTQPDDYNIKYRKKTSLGWQSIESITDKSTGQYHPSIAIDSDDVIHVVWYGLGWGTNTSYYNIIYRKRTPSGWQSPLSITDKSALQRHPGLIWAPHPTISNVKPGRTRKGCALVWADETTVKFGKVFLEWEVPFGTNSYTINSLLEKIDQISTFSIDAYVGEVLLESTTIDVILQKALINSFIIDARIREASVPSITIDAVLVEPSPYYTVAISVPSNSTEFSAQRKLVRASDGTYWCVFCRVDENYYRQIYVAYSTNKGKTWTIEQVSFATADQYNPSIAIDSQDNIHVVWAGAGWGTYPAIRNIQYRKRTSSGWQPQESITNVNNVQYRPVVAIDSNDNVHVVWYGQGWGLYYNYYNIQYRKRTSSGWQDREAVTDKKGHQFDPAIAIDSQNNIHVVWYGKGWGTNYERYNIQYRKRTSDGWQTQEAVTNEEHDQQHPSIAVDSWDCVHVVWSGQGWSGPYIFDIRYRKRTLVSWLPHEAVTYTKGEDQHHPSIAIDKFDKIHVVWHGKGWGENADKNNIQYKRKTSDGWQAQISLTDSSYDQYHPGLIWALHPTISELKTNRPKSGYAFIWTSGSSVKIYKSKDLRWERLMLGVSTGWARCGALTETQNQHQAHPLIWALRQVLLNAFPLPKIITQFLRDVIVKYNTPSRSYPVTQIIDGTVQQLRNTIVKHNTPSHIYHMNQITDGIAQQLKSLISSDPIQRSQFLRNVLTTFTLTTEHHLRTAVGGAPSDIIGFGDGTSTTFTSTLTYTPHVSSVVIHYTINGASYEGVVDEDGNITGTYITSGAIDPNGHLTLTFTIAPDSGSSILASYTRRMVDWSLKVDGVDFSTVVSEVHVSQRESEKINHIEVTVKDPSKFTMCDPAHNWGTERIQLTVGDTTYSFLLESREGSEVEFTIWGKQHS